MKHKKVLLRFSLFLIVFFRLLLLSSCSSVIFNDTPTEIQNDFYMELHDDLKTQYGITVPEKAILIKGINTHSFRDPALVLLYEFPYENNNIKQTDADSIIDFIVYICNLLKIERTEYSFIYEDTCKLCDWNNDMGGVMDASMEKKGNSTSIISWSIKDKNILIRIVIWHPIKYYE